MSYKSVGERNLKEERADMGKITIRHSTLFFEENNI